MVEETDREMATRIAAKYLRMEEYVAKIEEYKAVEANIQELVKTFDVGYFNAEIAEKIRKNIELLSNDLDYLGDVLTTLEDLGQRLTI